MKIASEFLATYQQVDPFVVEDASVLAVHASFQEWEMSINNASWARIKRKPPASPTYIHTRLKLPLRLGMNTEPTVNPAEHIQPCPGLRSTSNVSLAPL